MFCHACLCQVKMLQVAERLKSVMKRTSAKHGLLVARRPRRASVFSLEMEMKQRFSTFHRYSASGSKRRQNHREKGLVRSRRTVDTLRVISRAAGMAVWMRNGFALSLRSLCNFLIPSGSGPDQLGDS